MRRLAGGLKYGTNADAGIDIEGPFTWATRLFGMVLGLVWGVSHAVPCFYCVYWKLYLCLGGHRPFVDASAHRYIYMVADSRRGSTLV